MYKKSITNVMDVMNGIKEKNVEITDNLSGLREKIEKVDLKVENVTDTMKGIKEKNIEVADNLSELHGKIEKLENINDKEEITASETPAVAFNAREAVEYSGTDTVVFSTVILNEGKAYNDKTGFFTAPIDGIYQFNAHLCFVREIDVEYYLKVESNSIASGEYRVPQGTTDLKCTSFSAVALVRKGEKVHVGGMSFKNLQQASNDWNSFSGVLTHKV
ncbi:heavy metal-binding protein HIP-like [Mercenaria mercenaria]|uniref:heavy metal-binding protein HIP-like n=1 Tax=Mercenaria mercenaria TaxID=6596 RepID=UPI00234E536D|nr:heavy metal-binding protein HIP-like [Mercenaria mercenaria]